MGIVLCALFFGVYQAQAIGGLIDQNADARVMGIGGALSVLLVSAVPDSQARTRLFAEVGETRLFEVPGLKTDYLDIGARRGSLGVIVSAVQLSSPIGGERLLSVEPFLWGRGRWIVSGVAGLHAVSFGGRRLAHLVSIGARMSARLTRRLDIGYTVENYRITGEPVPGANTSLHVVFHSGYRTVGVACVRLDRYGNMGVTLASRVRIGRRLETSLGYDDAAETFAGAVAVRFARLKISFGAFVHPVLGVSKSISVGWWQ